MERNEWPASVWAHFRSTIVPLDARRSEGDGGLTTALLKARVD